MGWRDGSWHDWDLWSRSSGPADHSEGLTRGVQRCPGRGAGGVVMEAGLVDDDGLGQEGFGQVVSSSLMLERLGVGTEFLGHKETWSREGSGVVERVVVAGGGRIYRDRKSVV